MLIKRGWSVHLSLSKADPSKPELVLQLGHRERVANAAFGPDGRYILTNSMSDAILWDVATGRQLRTYLGAVSAAFSPNGRHVLIGYEHNNAILWDITTSQQLHSINGPIGRWNSDAFAPTDDRFLVPMTRRRFSGTWKRVRKPNIRGTHRRSDVCCVQHDGQHILTGSNDKSAILWERSTGQKVRTFDGHDGAVISVVSQSQWTSGSDWISRRSRCSLGRNERTNARKPPECKGW